MSGFLTVDEAHARVRELHETAARRTLWDRLVEDFLDSVAGRWVSEEQASEVADILLAVGRDPQIGVWS